MKVSYAPQIAAAVLLLSQSGAHAIAQEGSTRIFENERVVIWNVASNAPDQQSSAGRQLTRVWVSLADGRVRVTNARNPDRGRAILIELKEYPVAPLRLPRGVPPAFPREGATRIFDNERVAIWDVMWTTGAKTPLHFHDKDVVAVYLGAGTVRSIALDGASTATPRSFGEALFLPRGRTHVEECIEGPRRDIIIELK